MIGWAYTCPSTGVENTRPKLEEAIVAGLSPASAESQAVRRLSTDTVVAAACAPPAGGASAPMTVAAVPSADNRARRVDPTMAVPSGRCPERQVPAPAVLPGKCRSPDCRGGEPRLSTGVRVILDQLRSAPISPASERSS